MPGKVTLETHLPAPGPVISASAVQVQQILSNLITNAWEALGDNAGSVRLEVKAISRADISISQCFPSHWQPLDERYACLELTDTGCGIAGKDVENLFDPFYSSKFTGRGLGLAVVLGIVRAHGGAVLVESQLGRGSKFQVLFPLSAQEVPRPPEKPSPHSVIEPGGVVLLVEDEGIVRDMAAAILKRLDLIVLEAMDGVEAVEIFRQRRDEIRCVLCDLTMPRMNGWETLTALRQLAPGIPIILASGYDKAQVMSGDHPDWPQAFLAKPYTRQALIAAISQALASEWR
jgi:CheY-like chemotaxis protein